MLLGISTISLGGIALEAAAQKNKQSAGAGNATKRHDKD